MKAETIDNTTTIYRSEHRPDVTTDDQRLADAITWADQYPYVWKIVTGTKSKAFGRISCVYIGWAQKSMAPEAITLRPLPGGPRPLPGLPPRRFAPKLPRPHSPVAVLFSAELSADFREITPSSRAKPPRVCFATDQLLSTTN